MKNLRYGIFMFLSMTFFYAEARPSDNAPQQVYFAGKIHGDMNKVKKVQFIFDNFFTNTDTDRVKMARYITPDAQGFFDALLPPIRNMRVIHYFSITYDSAYYYLEDYPVEPGDSIMMDFTITGDEPLVTFTGKGAEKYNVRRALELQMRKFDKVRAAWENVAGLKLPDLVKAKADVISCSKEVEAYLEKYKPDLMAEVYETLKADALDYIGGHKNLLFKMLLFRNKIILKKDLQQAFLTSEYPIYFTTPDIGRQAAKYIDYLVSYATLKLLFVKGPEKLAFGDLFDFLKTHYTGIMLDRMLLSLVYCPQTPVIYEKLSIYYLRVNQRNKYINEALNIIKNPEIHALVVSIANQTLTGADAYQFSLPDLTGKRVSLSDFKGKVVIMDLWFTGCGGCAAFSDKIKDSIKPLFKNDSDLVYVSICTDRDMKMWLSSYKTNVYSEASNINLYTDGQGFDHPLIKFYGLSGLPFALLIDREGKIVDAITFLDMNDIESKIRKVLLQR